MLWKRSAIDFEEWSIAARAEFVNEARKIVFAGSGFAGDQQGSRRGRDFLGQRQQALRRGVGGNPRETLGHNGIVARSAWQLATRIGLNCAKGHGMTKGPVVWTIEILR